MRKQSALAFVAVVLALSWLAFLTVSPSAAQQGQQPQQGQPAAQEQQAQQWQVGQGQQVQQGQPAQRGQGQGQGQGQLRMTWEYEIASPAKVNAFGQQGWEAFAVTVEQGNSVVWLKRRVQ